MDTTIKSNERVGKMKKSIVLTGFMGVGKSTTGKLVAAKLKRKFIDTDKKIERHFQMTIPEIFKQYGEETFRKKEKEIILNCLESGAHIISVGGGAFLQEEIKKLCLEKSTVVYLYISWENWQKRLPYLIDSRPLLQEKTMEEIKELFYKRMEFYKDYHVKIDTDGKHSEQIADEIIEKLRLK